MSDIIQLLPDSIANQIAAGEVVQRPASVIKELVENSIDAGARSVKIIVKDAGKQLIQIIDDGSGMSETDARMCFERHATSKIKSIEDLYRIRTFGFRGEAMASIAAAARVELKTKRKTEEVATEIIIEGSKVVTHGPCSWSDGTSIAVKNLFFSIPARRNFLKSNQIELKHIIDEFLHAALAYPQVKFVLVNEEEELYHLNSGSYRQRIVSVFGKKYDNLLVPVEEEMPILSVKGFIGKPEAARKTRGEQNFFVNGRYIRSAYLNHAVQNAFEGLIPLESYPFYVLYLEMDPSKVDVNVHPTKTEVKFDDERGIYAILKASVKRALSQHHIAPAIDFEQENSFSGFTNNSGPSGPSIRVNTPSEAGTIRFEKKSAKGDWNELYKVLSLEQEESTEHEDEESERLADDLAATEEKEEKQPVQLHKRYIISPIRSGLMIINQQVAHERILYEKYIVSLEKEKSTSQQQLFPEVVELNPADTKLVEEILPDIKSLGFSIELFGKNTYLVNGLPAEMEGGEARATFEKFLEDFKHNAKVDKLDRRENLARVMAKSAAIKPGKTLAKEEMKLLIDQLFACEMPYYAPDGRPVFITISSAELEKKFQKQ